MPIQHETELYAPVKAYFEKMGYEVRGEVRNCDLVAIRGEEDPVIVELKKIFNIPLLVQGLDRLRTTDRVYVAVEMNAKGRAPHGLGWSDLVRLCRRLGLGLITVRFYKSKKPHVEVQCDPETYVPRKTARRTAGLVAEFRQRSADYNVGGSTKVKLVTAYREKALHCAYAMHTHGPMTTKQLREITGSSKITEILQKNFYGWYRRVNRGTYELTPAGREALRLFDSVIQGLDAGTLPG
ncbi:DUF2161 domain-containing phosphodiesterase [Gorillibacterium sp. sgz5001074]|uniref:DUF2161 domain-containing phosphodiesterase n=1 Tax=Gorillibacterium sp. sgz5001074 TaxID=3446695 RepID=UPI003F66760C